MSTNPIQARRATPPSSPTEPPGAEALKQSEARYRALAEASSQAVWMWSPSTGAGDFEATQQWWEQITGQDPAEQSGSGWSGWLDRVHPEDRERAEAAWSTAMTTGLSYEVEYRLLTRTGEPRYILARAVPVRGPEGEVREWVGTLSDVTERRLAEQAVRDSEEKYRSLFESTKDAVFIGDLNGKYADVNSAAAQMLGVPREQLIGLSSRTFVPPGWMEKADQIRQSLLATGFWEGEFPMRRPDGTTVWAEYRTRFDGRHIVGVARDVTERRRTAEALRESERRLSTLLSNLPGMAYRCPTTPPWPLTYASDGVLVLTGRPAEDFLEQRISWVDIVHPDDLEHVEQEVTAALLERRQFSMVYRIVHVSGEERWVLDRGCGIDGPEGRPVALEGFAGDVTRLKKAEEELKEADRRKDEFLAMLAHELRNPLAPIRNAAEILQRIGPDNHVHLRQARGMIDRQVSHMARLVDDLLDVSRISRGKILLRTERLDLVPLVHATVEDHRSLLEGGGLSLAAVLPDEPLWVMGDPTRLSQILGNLLQNANKFTNPGGHVTVRLSRDERGDALLAVEDTGIGMEPDILSHLFEPFSQADRSLDRSRGGLGLGLALVKGLVDLHGGTAEASSGGKGHGATFTIRLPLSREAGDAAEPVPSASPEVKSLRILVVEDNRDAAESLGMLLDLSGHRVELAYSGQEGLDAARRFRPDVAICDIGLPGGMDGYDLARALRACKEAAGARLIALSGYGQDEDKRRAREAGFDEHLTKPVDPGALIKLLEALP
jgi:PAS domain S-box-containing protein